MGICVSKKEATATLQACDVIPQNNVSHAQERRVSKSQRFFQDIEEYRKERRLPLHLIDFVESKNPNTHSRWFDKLVDQVKSTKDRSLTNYELYELICAAMKGTRMGNKAGVLRFYGLKTKMPFRTMFSMPVNIKYVPDGDTMTVGIRCDNDVVECMFLKQNNHIRKIFDDYVKLPRNEQYSEFATVQGKLAPTNHMIVRDVNKTPVLCRKYKIRFSGVDAPESKQEFGKESTEFLHRLVDGKSIKCEIFETDQYGRIVCDLFIGNTYIQGEMLKRGMVWHYGAYDDRDELKSLFEKAKEQKIGIFANPHAQAPWDWRKENKRY
eukprot:TRINITY_DN777877_c0_g1_i1.p1 TRINITY_DN777877_c0_g1~~TRINITY_DN777877_c0_g1_i1.p1  ORF type:complete len:324 (-),score=57.19 TRINITY_DN777877_c0_g1_i1:311-1282(-)